jgi:hypothetical protein
MHGSRVWHDGDGEESGAREGREEGEKGPARILTATRSFLDTCSTVGSGGAAVRQAAEALQQWRRWLGLRGRVGGGYGVCEA